MTDELTLKAWAINASRNPYDEHQKAHADATLKLIEERDSLRAELDVARERLGPAGYKIIQEVTKLRAELAEQRRDSARDAQELARCHQIELTKLRAEIESYSAAHHGQFDRIFQLISEVDCFREALKEITATVKSYTNKDELDNCCDWGGNCQAGTMGSVFDSVLKTISKLQSKGM